MKLRKRCWLPVTLALEVWRFYDADRPFTFLLFCRCWAHVGAAAKKTPFPHSCQSNTWITTYQLTGTISLCTQELLGMTVMFSNKVWTPCLSANRLLSIFTYKIKNRPFLVVHSCLWYKPISWHFLVYNKYRKLVTTATFTYTFILL